LSWSTPRAIAVDFREFEVALRDHKGSNAIVNLSLSSGGDVTALVRDVQYDPLSRLIIHLDFQHISLTEHRYMREDVEYGLAFLVSVCEWAGVACPVGRGLLALGAAVLERDLRASGRTLENLGLATLTPVQLRERLA